MDQLYLGYTGWEYAFMAAWFATWIGVIYSYVRITDLKDQLAYHQYLNDLMIRKQ